MITSCVSHSTSPDDEILVFASARSGDGDIYAWDQKSETANLLIATSYGEGNPVLDRARNRIVHQVFTTNAVLLKSGDTTLFEDPNGDAPPVWSADGKRIAYSKKVEEGEMIFIGDSSGVETEVLPSRSQTNRYPIFSPSGDKLAYLSRFDEGWRLQIYSLRTSLLTFESSAFSYLGHPSWSPDGEQIAVDTRIGEYAEIGIINLQTGELSVVASLNGNSLKPSWSIDGKRIVFGSDTDDGDWDIYSVDIESGRITNLIDSPGFDGAPIMVPASIVSGYFSAE